MRDNDIYYYELVDSYENDRVISNYRSLSKAQKALKKIEPNWQKETARYFIRSAVLKFDN
jgi:hypothetical protein